MALLGSGTRQKREEIVREHMDSENRHEYDATMATFHRPRYELVGTGEVHDGTEEVEAYFEETRRAFPDQRNELIALHHAENAVIVEFWLRGTHSGPLRALPPTGKEFETRMTAFFVFEEDKLVCERVYFNPGDIMRQLGVARDPLSVSGRIGTAVAHPVAIGRGLIRRVTGR